MRRLILTSLLCLAPFAAQATTLPPREPAKPMPTKPVSADVTAAEAVIVAYAKAMMPLAKTASDRSVSKADREAAAAQIKSLTKDVTTALKGYRPEVVAQAGSAAARDLVKAGVMTERQVREVVAHVQREVQRAVAEMKRPVPTSPAPQPVATAPVSDSSTANGSGAAGGTGTSIANALSSATSGL